MSTQTCNRRNLLGVFCLVCLVIAGAYWALGDEFEPWIRSWRGIARDALQGLTNPDEPRLARDREAIADVRRAVDALRGRIDESLMRCHTMSDERDIARDQHAEATGQLALAEKRRKTGQPFLLADGRCLSAAESDGHVEDVRRRAVASAKNLSRLEDLLAGQLAHTAQLECQWQEASKQLEELDRCLEALTAKMSLYREGKDLKLDQSHGSLAAELKAGVAGLQDEIRDRLAMVHSLLSNGTPRR